MEYCLFTSLYYFIDRFERFRRLLDAEMKICTREGVGSKQPEKELKKQSRKQKRKLSGQMDCSGNLALKFCSIQFIFIMANCLV